METVGVSRSASNQSRRRRRNRRKFAGPCGSETKAVENDGETETCRLPELAIEDDEKAGAEILPLLLFSASKRPQTNESEIDG